MSCVYWRNVEKYRLIFDKEEELTGKDQTDFWGVLKLTSDILIGDNYCAQDFTFLLENKIDLIITTECQTAKSK